MPPKVAKSAFDNWGDDTLHVFKDILGLPANHTLVKFINESVIYGSVEEILGLFVHAQHAFLDYTDRSDQSKIPFAQIAQIRILSAHAAEFATANSGTEMTPDEWKAITKADFATW